MLTQRSAKSKGAICSIVFAWLCGVLAAFLANTMQHRVAPCYNTLLCKQTIKRAVVQNSRPVIIFCWLLKQAVGNHAPTHRGFTSAHSYGTAVAGSIIITVSIWNSCCSFLYYSACVSFSADCFILLCKLSPSKSLMTILFHDGYVQTIGISATESHRTTQIQYFVLAR